MKISVESLKKMEACGEGIEAFEKMFGIEEVEYEEALLQMAEVKPEYSVWWLTETFSKEQNIKLAIFSAELVLYIFEDKYPNDDRPRKAIEAAKEYLKNPTEENRITAASASTAASAASYAASAVSSTASASASASYASYAVSSTAAYAVAASAYAAEYEKAKGETYLKIIKYGIKLMKEAGK